MTQIPPANVRLAPGAPVIHPDHGDGYVLTLDDNSAPEWAVIRVCSTGGRRVCRTADLTITEEGF